MLLLRSLVFNGIFYLNLLLFMIAGLPLFLAPRSWAMSALKLWARLSLWWLESIVGIRLEVRGLEHVPEGPVLIAAKHQSFFETFALLPFFADPAMVLKRELLLIPLYGWFGVKFGMIPVDRGKGALALKKLVAKAAEAARAGRQILIFPEGTRRTPGAPPAYRPGVAALYLNLGVPCVPVGLNSGLFWPRRKFLRYPGTLVMEFLPPIEPGLPRIEFSRKLESAIEGATSRLVLEAKNSSN